MRIKLILLTTIFWINFSLSQNQVEPDVQPVFTGCEKKKNNNSIDKCFEKNLKKFITKNFPNKPFQYNGSNINGIQRVSILFKINKSGEITDIKVRAPYPSIEIGVTKIIESIPKMIRPAFFDGKPMKVPYSLPVIFILTNGKINKSNINF